MLEHLLLIRLELRYFTDITDHDLNFIDNDVGL